MKNSFSKSMFSHGEVSFTIQIEPVSLQNKNEDKKRFKRKIREITKNSNYIITNTCWIAIDYHCQHIRRRKNPGVYDMDNIIKPILDGLVGIDGLIIDDCIIDRVIVNWMLAHDDDYLEITLEYPDLDYRKKSDLIFLKSKSGWCYPFHEGYFEDEGWKKLIYNYFNIWDSIKTEDDFCNPNIRHNLPIQRFIPFNKIKDKGYKIIDI